MTFTLLSGVPYSESDSELYDYVNDESGGMNNMEGEAVMKTPDFMSTSQTLIVNEGDTVRLPCTVDRLEGFVMLWKRQADILTVASQIINKVRQDKIKAPAFKSHLTCLAFRAIVLFKFLNIFSSTKAAP